MAENANWKQVGDIYRTSGPILEVGSFISASGNKVDISEQDKAELFANIDENIPFTIGHDKYAPTVGYAVKVAETEDSIEHNGIVYDNQSFEQAIAMGYNNISPVIDFLKDETGKIVGKKIVKLGFVPNPAMKSNKTDVTRFAFSAPEVSSMTDGIPQTNTQTNNGGQEQVPTTLIQGQQIPVNTFAAPTPQTPQPPAFDPALLANIASSIAEGVAAKFSGQLEALQQEISVLKAGNVQETPLDQSQFAQVQGIATPPQATNMASAEIAPETVNGIPKELFEQFAQLKAENQTYKDQMAREEKSAYTNKLAELRALGHENPEKLVSHLKDTKSKIETLDAFKVALVKNTPMNSPQSVPLGTEGGKNQKQQPTVLGLADSLRISIDAETAQKLAQRMRLPLQ